MTQLSGRRLLSEWSATVSWRASILAITFIAASLGQVAITETGIRLNVTGSMPRGLYHLRASSRTVKRGDIVAVCLPLRTASLGRERGYLGSGICPESVEPLLKRVVAVEGDIVVASPTGIRVNGRLLPGSRRLQVDTRGRHLVEWSTPLYRMPSGMILLYAPSERSWDSRYWGPVKDTNVIGLADPLIAF
jgi:conjugative transfer signal peptidase TraF